MPNKLKDIFTKEPLERKTRFEFFDEKGYADFIEGLKKVGEEGCPVEVKGVKAVHNTVGNGIANYSDECETEIVKSFIYPCAEPIIVKLNTEFGEEEICLNRIQIKNGFLINVSIGEVVKFMLKSNLHGGETTFSYTTDLKKASSINDLVRNMASALAFCRYIFKNEDELKTLKSEAKSQIVNIKGVLDHFDNSLRIFKHLDYINERFKLNILPSEFSDNHNYEDVEELYYTLQGVPIRSIESFNSLKSDVQELDVDKKEDLLGTAVNLTFIGNVTYDILGHEVTLFSANYLCNAVVGEFEESGEDRGTITLKPEADKSMYMTYTAYETLEEVNKGLKEILTRREEYHNAPTILQLIAKNYEEDKVK